MSKAMYHQIEEAKSFLEDAKRAYLKRFGWDCTSSMPGAYWLWRRDFADVDAQRMANHERGKFPTPPRPYGVITADTDLAIAMTASTLDERDTPEEVALFSED